MSLKDLESMIEGSGQSEATDRPIIVVVDDDALVRNSLETVLKDKYEVRTCPNGVEGVRSVDQNTSCVILDVRMPTHDGFWVCKHLRKRAPDVPIIFYSAYQDLKDPYDIINEHHPFGYVVKGDTLSTLLVLVANAVRHSERLREGRRTIARLLVAREQMRELQGELGNGSSSDAARSEPPTDRPSSVGPASRSAARPATGSPDRPSARPPAPPARPSSGSPASAPTRPSAFPPPSAPPAPGSSSTEPSSSTRPGRSSKGSVR